MAGHSQVQQSARRRNKASDQSAGRPCEQPLFSKLTSCRVIILQFCANFGGLRLKKIASLQGCLRPNILLILTLFVVCLELLKVDAKRGYNFIHVSGYCKPAEICTFTNRGYKVHISFRRFLLKKDKI